MYFNTAKSISLFCSVLQFSVPEVSKSKFKIRIEIVSVSVSVHSINDIPIDNAPLFQIELQIDNLSMVRY